MPSYTFTLVLDGPTLGPDELNALFDAGCDDATFGQRNGYQVAEFDRSASTFGAALTNAISDVEESVPTLSVVRVEPDDLVSAATIAERTGRSRESIRLLASGERGPGDFPEPVTWLDGTSKIWHWSQVASWFEQSLGEAADLGGAPQFVAALNGALETRRVLRELPPDGDLAFTAEDLAMLPALVTESTAVVQRHLAKRAG